MKRKKLLLCSLLILQVVVVCFGQEDVKTPIQWQNFLSRSDLVWTEMPTGWTTGAYTGNGTLGTIFWQHNNSIWFEVSRTDAYDHRNASSIYSGRYRMPNGNFTLAYKGKTPKGSMRLDLWNAEVRGQVNTGTGKISFRTLTHASDDVILLEVLTEGGETLDLTWHADTCQVPRASARGQKGTTPYPLQELQKVNDVFVSVQHMPEDTLYDTQGRGEGQFATAWKIVNGTNGRHYVYISEIYTYPGTSAAQDAVANVERAAKTGVDKFVTAHRQWWHDYYQKSFLSIPNARLESFYWIQMYKMASATRGDGPMIDLAGPWYMRGTKWPGIWWNLNVQCTYAPFFVANHQDVGSSLINWLWKNRSNLEVNGYGFGRYAIGRSSPLSLERKCDTVRYEAGNLGYALHNVWQQYRSTMDDEMLREKLFPLMKGHYKYFMDFYVEKRADGKYHLKPSFSPEYTSGKYLPPPDCNYNLSIFKWMLSAMLYANDRLTLSDPLITEVKDVYANLAPYPVDAAEGFMVGEGLPFSYSHRHWSHLFMIYPFYEYTYDSAAQGELIDRSLKHWLSYSQAYRGYSWLAASSMVAMKGDGDAALDYILRSMDHDKYPAQPNTLYIEGAPVIETPLLGARAIQDLILTSYNGVIRVFPALPTAWKNASFHKLRAEGAFLVSAKKGNGRTEFVRIESLAGEPCKVKTDLAGKIKTQGKRKFKVNDLGNGVVEIDLKKGESVILYTGELTKRDIAPVPVTDRINYWGTITPAQKPAEKIGLFKSK